MRRHFKWDKKYLYWGLTAFCVIAGAILFYMALNYLPAFGSAIATLVGILSPFIWGLVITYLLAPATKSLQAKVFGPLGRRLYRKNKKKDGSRFARGMSVLISEILLLVIIAALVYLIIPQLYSSIYTIVENSNTYIDTASRWVENVLKDYPRVEEDVMGLLGNFNEDLMSWVKSTVLPGLGNIASSLTSGVISVLKAVYNLVIGIIVSVYILSNLESFSANSKRILYSVFSLDAAEKIRTGLDFIDKTFMGFITGKLLDSAIIGLICYIVCAILRMPYALLVSVIVGVTNVIPFFGPIIGAIPGAFLILLVDPVKCLVFIIFIAILQQIDGNLIGPKILGSSIGINGFWVMFSIILGAGLFGFWGMLLGVPVFVVIYTWIKNGINRKLKRSDLPWETADYMEIDHIDPITHEPVMKDEEEK